MPQDQNESYEEALERVRARRLAAAEQRRRRSRTLGLTALGIGVLVVAGIVLSQVWGSGGTGDEAVSNRISSLDKVSRHPFLSLLGQSEIQSGAKPPHSQES